MRIGALEIDRLHRRVTLDGRLLDLTSREYMLLLALAHQGEHVILRDGTFGSGVVDAVQPRLQPRRGSRQPLARQTRRARVDNQHRAGQGLPSAPESVMSLRARYVIAISAITLVTLGGAFVAVSIRQRRPERQLDLALALEAREEAAEAATLGGDELAISNRPGPRPTMSDRSRNTASSTGPPAGNPGADTFLEGQPSTTCTPLPRGQWIGLQPVVRRRAPARHACCDPGAPGHDHVARRAAQRPRCDEHFLLRAMATVFGLALLWTMLVAIAVVWRLTRDHRTIAGSRAARRGRGLRCTRSTCEAAIER